MTSEIDKLKHFHAENYSGTNFTDDLNVGVCPNCIFNNYLCYGFLCNIVVLKVVKDKEMRNNK